MVLAGEFQSLAGKKLQVRADTICLHGDTPGAAELARLVRSGLETTGIQVAALDH